MDTFEDVHSADPLNLREHFHCAKTFYTDLSPQCKRYSLPSGNAFTTLLVARLITRVKSQHNLAENMLDLIS